MLVHRMALTDRCLKKGVEVGHPEDTPKLVEPATTDEADEHDAELSFLLQLLLESRLKISHYGILVRPIPTIEVKVISTGTLRFVSL